MTDLNALLLRAQQAREAVVESAAAENPHGWAPPVPLDDCHRPDFSADYLPEPLGELAVALSTATQTPLAMSGMLLLAGVSAAVAKTIEVHPREGWIEPVNLYVAVSLGSGNRKSAVVGAVSKPHRAWELSQAEVRRVEIAQAQSRREIAEHRLEKLRKELARENSGDEYLIKRAEESELTERLISDPTLQVLPAPRLLIEDSTVERAAKMMTEQNGRISVLSAEGGIFGVIAGRYSEAKDVGLDLFLKAHAGDDLPIDRIGRETQALIAPALTLGLAIQPHVLTGLAANNNYRGTGLLARFAYACPESIVGRRVIAPPPVPGELEQQYHDLITGLLRWPTDQRPVYLSGQAQEALQAFETALEPRLGADQDLEHLADWAAKLAGLVVRISGLCHAVGCQLQGRLPWEEPISRQTIERAISLGEDFLIPHAKTAFVLMNADPAMEEARRVLRKIMAWSTSTITRRDLHQCLRGTFPRSEMLDRPLDILTHHGYLRPIEPSTARGPGRKPSPVYEINPLIRAHNSRVSQF